MPETGLENALLSLIIDGTGLFSQQPLRLGNFIEVDSQSLMYTRDYQRLSKDVTPISHSLLKNLDTYFDSMFI